MPLHEIVLPETKPETEWVRGRPLQKVSPKRNHSLLQGALVMELHRWAAGRGEVGPEWRFRVAPPGEVRRPLAPDVAVEILSSGDRRVDVDDQIGVYLRAGSSLFIVVDPERRMVELHDRNAVTLLDESAAIEHAALPGFSYPINKLFGVLRRP